MERILAIFLGYLIGNIQMAHIVSKYIAKVDIRKMGSGNVGATNVIRVLGAKYGIPVLIFDIFKGILACIVATTIITGDRSLLFDLSTGVEGYTISAYGALGAVLGHNFPAVLKFKGGKGAATTLGFVIYINWILGISVFISGIILAKFTKYVSISSILFLSITTPIFWVLGYSQEIVLVSAVLSILTIYQHRTNILRLLNGTEKKFSSSKK